MVIFDFHQVLLPVNYSTVSDFKIFNIITKIYLQAIKIFSEVFILIHLNFIISTVINTNLLFFKRILLLKYKRFSKHLRPRKCPLTGTGITYVKRSDIGVSGKLFENNLIFYDRASMTYWSQMYGVAIKGENIGEKFDIKPGVEMSWSLFKEMYPNAQMLSRDTGYSRNYDRYPYERYDYKNSGTIIFPSAYKSNQEPYNLYHPKSLTVILKEGDKWGLVPFDELKLKNPMQINLNGQNIVIFYDEEAKFAVSYISSLNGKLLEFTTIAGDYPNSFGSTVYKDQFGNVYNIKGEIIESVTLEGSLYQSSSYIGFWFAATAFFGGYEIFTSNETLKFDIEDKLGTHQDAGRSVNIMFFGIVFGLILLPIFATIKWRNRND
jgi:hypothetical protein